MKKLLLILFLGVFLFSSVSATITISNGTAFDRPTFNYTLVESDGTDELLEDTTYYFQCFFGGYMYQGATCSPASIESNITTNSTHRWINQTWGDQCDNYFIPDGSYKGVICRWDTESFLTWGGEGYMPWSRTSNDTDTYGHRRWITNFGNPSLYPDLKCSNNKQGTIIKNSDLLDSTSSSSRAMHHPEIAIPLTSRNELEKFYNITKGTISIQIEGTPTLTDLKQSLYDTNNTDMSGISTSGVTVLGGLYGTGTLNLERERITTILANNKLGGLTLTKGSILEFSTSPKSITWNIVRGNFYDSTYRTSGLANSILDSIGITENLNFFAGGANPTNYKSYNGWNFYDSLFHQSRYFGEIDHGYNSNFYGVYDYHTPSNVKLNQTSHFENLTFYNNGLISYDIYNGLSYVDNCYNNTYIIYDMKNVISDRADKRPIHRYGYEPPEQICGLTMNYTYHGDIKFTIQDTEGNNLDNVTITLEGANTFSENTTNGKATLDVDFYEVYYNYSNPTYYASTLEESNYNLTISKDGYSTIKTQITLDSSKDLIYALETFQETRTPASFVLDKIISLQELNETDIVYNITLKTVNRGGSVANNITLIDSDYNLSPYNLGDLPKGNSTLISYLKQFPRNSTTYNLTFSKATVNGTDSFQNQSINTISNKIVLIVPSSTADTTLTILKNAYYNSENSTSVNYTLTIEVINSGGTDLSNITLLDSDLNFNTKINLNRTQKYNYSNSIIIEKAASNTNKLFDKTNAIVDSITYQSNQINIQVPGYGGPADAIVNAPASIQTSTSFDTLITVLNMNQDIGQDFTINYWITNVAENINYTSGEQTIYVPALGESNLTATLTSPTIAGDYRYKAIVSWVGGIATSYDTFNVFVPTSEESTGGSSGGRIIGDVVKEIVCDSPKIEIGGICCLDQNNNSICDSDEILEGQEQETNKPIEEINSEKLQFFKKIFKKMNDFYISSKNKISQNKNYLFIGGGILILIFISFILIKIISKIKPKDTTRLKSMKNIKVYGADGSKIGKIREIYLEKKKAKIYGWLIKVDKEISKKIKKKNILVKQKHVNSIKHIMIIDKRISEHLEKLDSKI